MSYNRCKDIHKFRNKYLPSAYKTQVEFRSHFAGKVRLMVQDIQYLPLAYKTQVDFRSHFSGKKVRLMVREIRYMNCCVLLPFAPFPVGLFCMVFGVLGLTVSGRHAILFVLVQCNLLFV